MHTAWTAALFLVLILSVAANGWLILEEREQQYACEGVQR